MVNNRWFFGWILDVAGGVQMSATALYSTMNASFCCIRRVSPDYPPLVHKTAKDVG